MPRAAPPTSRLQALLDRCDLGLDAAELPPASTRRIRALTLATLAVCALATASIFQFTRIGATEIAGGIVVAMALGLCNLELLRRLRRPILAGHLAIAIFAGALTHSNLHTGGFYDPNFSWFYVVPFAAALLLDASGAWIWFGAVLALTLGFWTAQELGVSFPSSVPFEQRAEVALFNRITALAGLGLIASSFVASQRRAEHELERANRTMQSAAAYVQLLEHAAVAANEAVSLEDAMATGVRRICETMGWVAGHVYRVDDDGNLVSSEFFHVDDAQRFQTMMELTRQTKFAPGEGMPGRALETRRPQALTDLAAGGARAKEAQRLGLTAAWAIPVLVHGEVAAVIECVAREVHAPNPRMLDVLAHVGVQLGRVGERAALQERLRQSQRLEAVGRLAAGVAHEINNPMAYVRSNLNQLNHEWKELRRELEKHEGFEASATRIEDLDALLEESLEGVERTVSIVRDMKEMSHSATAARAVADVGELVEQAVRIASARAPSGVRIESSVPAEPVRLFCAATQLRQVFVNVVANAIDAMGECGTLRIATRVDAGYVLARFDDDGPGIREEVRERIFDPFFTTKGVGEGTGLGLAISYEIVSAHGGEIRVNSTPGSGASIEVWLPLREAAPA